MDWILVNCKRKVLCGINSLLFDYNLAGKLGHVFSETMQDCIELDIKRNTRSHSTMEGNYYDHENNISCHHRKCMETRIWKIGIIYIKRERIHRHSVYN